MNPFLNVNIEPSRHSRMFLSDEGIAIQEAINVVRTTQDTWAGKQQGQLWCRGETPDGRKLRVLMGAIAANTSTMIVVHEVT